MKLKACGVNPADTFFRSLGPYIGDGHGYVLGHDGAGVVEETGPDVETVKPGDAVCFCYGGIGADPGTYAEYAVVPEAVVVHKPDGVDFVKAAVLPLVFITIWEALVERAAVKEGEYVLVHAGAGGTGHVGIQLARQLGARVATTVSTAEKQELVSRLGAERVIRYRDEELRTALEDWTSGRGVDVALDNVGSEVMQHTFGTMATYGRLVTLMGLAGDTPDEEAYNRNLSIHNVMMLTPMWKRMDQRVAEQAGMAQTGIDWLAQGKLDVIVQQTFQLDQAAEAHRVLESGGAIGKLALVMD